MTPNTITPLPKHRGQNGVIAALFVLVAAIVVVWITQPKPPAPPADDAPRKVLPKAPPPAASMPAPAPEDKTVAPTATEVKPGVGNGVVTFDESRTAHIFAPVNGFVGKVNFKQGKPVRAGETLATLYSVEVYLAERDLITQVQQFTTQDLLSNARRRLQRFMMPPTIIAKVEQTGVANSALPLIALRSGVIVESKALPGLYTEPNELFTITEPSYVWVIADLPAADVDRIKIGTPAKLTIDGLAKPVTSNVAYIYRMVDDGMRKVRFELVTPKIVSPGAAVTVEVKLD